MSTENKLIRFDWAMKTLLRDKANFDILEGFLSAVLHQDVSIIEILESESNVSDMDLKLNRVDILIQDEQQRYVIIEIQNCHITAYLERILFGVSKVIVDNVKSGEDYREISKVVSISILYFNLGRGKDYVFYGSTEFRGLNHNEPLIFRRRRKDDKKLEKLKSQDIFPEYYLINVERFEDEMKTDLDEWIYLFKHAALPPHCKAKNLVKAGEKLNLLKMGAEERHRYDMYLMALVNEKDAIDTALNKGQHVKALEIAQKMLKAGMDIETIVAMTDLNIETIVAMTDLNPDIIK